jgi:hypothetical protein
MVEKPHVSRLHGGGSDSDVTKALGFSAALSGDDTGGNEEGSSELVEEEHCCPVREIGELPKFLYLLERKARV